MRIVLLDLGLVLSFCFELSLCQAHQVKVDGHPQLCSFLVMTLCVLKCLVFSFHCLVFCFVPLRVFVMFQFIYWVFKLLPQILVSCMLECTPSVPEPTNTLVCVACSRTDFTQCHERAFNIWSFHRTGRRRILLFCFSVVY